MYEKFEERKDVELRRKYDNGEISVDEFYNKLFSSRVADRDRRKIVKKNEKLNKEFQKA
ncbi:hypothetical protein [Oceanobacillus manasiensis]|uniref:hypothetical protein n=1 Tax=Oceanobacillus manasiensis TaxID=586413 RepID=UPI000A585489|nr:hypothetical protein [Oceanobacillus manasiensis]